ncbi:MAG: hypothetical protein ABI134_10770, partial [Byssovorax sp.]
MQSRSPSEDQDAWQNKAVSTSSCPSHDEVTGQMPRAALLRFLGCKVDASPPLVLNKMGAIVDGAGTDVIHIEGRDELAPFDHAIIADRIEAGT